MTGPAIALFLYVVAESIGDPSALTTFMTPLPHAVAVMPSIDQSEEIPELIFLLKYHFDGSSWACVGVKTANRYDNIRLISLEVTVNLMNYRFFDDLDTKVRK